MSEEWLSRGYITLEELAKVHPLPDEERLEKRPVAIPECPQRIPCTPCREICPTGAIKMDKVNDPPQVNYDKCIGCSLCVQICPGLAFFMVHYVGDKARVTMPYEYLPLPKRGDTVKLLNRKGEVVGEGTVRMVMSREMSRGDTAVITVEMDRELGMEVRAVEVREDE
ncbi:MAG: 4Fe-4S binding protein [Thermoplasmata archaeon]|nr:4Fe-4S binding protein [Thermoplasmata archaeon]